MITLWLQVLPFVGLLVVGVLAGRINERMHFRRLDQREGDLQDMLVNDCRRPPQGVISSLGLVTGEVVIGSDYFRTFVTRLRKLIGGELRGFESMMDRARREALVRMLEKARQRGANAVVNVRFETSNIGVMKKNHNAAMVELYAYGTALSVGTARGAFGSETRIGMPPDGSQKPA